MDKEKRRLGKWTVLGIIISSLSIFALIIHLRSYGSIRFDVPALVLLFIALIPWMSIFLDNATLPGGWRIEFKKLKEQQDKQDSDIDDITNFLFDNFLIGYTRVQLKNLNLRKRFPYKFQGEFEKELRNLLELRFIERHPGKGIRSAKKDMRLHNNLKDHFFVTDKGKWYLARLAKLREDENKG